MDLVDLATNMTEFRREGFLLTALYPQKEYPQWLILFKNILLDYVYMPFIHHNNIPYKAS